MLFESEIADALVAFKEDPGVKGEYTDEAIATLMVLGNVIQPEEGAVALCRDITTGYEWKIPYCEIGRDKGYDWLKKCYPRILSGIEERWGTHAK